MIVEPPDEADDVSTAASVTSAAGQYDSTDTTTLPSAAQYFSDDSASPKKVKKYVKKKKKRNGGRKLPKVPENEEIRYASPYQDSAPVDVREQLRYNDVTVGSINRAFDDTETSDARDKISYGAGDRDKPSSAVLGTAAVTSQPTVASSDQVTVDQNSNIELSSVELGACTIHVHFD